MSEILLEREEGVFTVQELANYLELLLSIPSLREPMV